MPGPSETQIDNLLRFLNDVETADDLICGFPAELSDQLAEGAKAILALREETGAFFSMADLAPLDELLAEVMPALLDAARHPLLATPPPEHYALIDFEASPMLIAGMVGVPILFAIQWAKIPANWARKFPKLHIALNFKRVELGQREVELNKRIKKLNDVINEAETELKNALKPPNPNHGVARQHETTIAINKPRLEQAKSELKEVLRDADALNKAVKKGNIKQVAAIVRANLKARLKKAAAVKEAADKAALAATTPAEKKKTQADLKKAHADFNELEDDIEAVDKEVGGP